MSEPTIEEALEALKVARKTMRAAWGAVTSGQIVDKEVDKTLERGFRDIDALLSRAASKGEATKGTRKWSAGLNSDQTDGGFSRSAEGGACNTAPTAGELPRSSSNGRADLAALSTPSPQAGEPVADDYGSNEQFASYLRDLHTDCHKKSQRLFETGHEAHAEETADIGWALWIAAKRLAALTSPAQEAEPVAAWTSELELRRSFASAGRILNNRDQHDIDAGFVVPLFAHPPSAQPAPAVAIGCSSERPLVNKSKSSQNEEPRQCGPSYSPAVDREAIDALLAFRHGNRKHLTGEHARLILIALLGGPRHD